jgi:hypothetical protein
MEKYYIISTKHTYPNDEVFTFWGENSNGYCWFKTWAGIYDEESIVTYRNRESEGLYIVASKTLRPFWKSAIYAPCYDNLIVSVLPNTEDIRKVLLLKKEDLKGGMTKITDRDILYFDNLTTVVRREQS